MGLWCWMNSKSGVTGGRNWRSFTVLIWCRYRQGNGCPNGWGKPGAKDRATGKRLEEREEDVDSPYRWGRSCNIRVSLEIRDFCVRNKGLWRVKPRSSGGKRPDFRMRKKGFFSFLSCLCRFKGVQGNEPIYIINIFILRCRIEPQWTENLYKPLIINGLYWAIDCTVFIWCEMSDLEPVSIFLNNNLIAASLTVPSAESNANS